MSDDGPVSEHRPIPPCELSGIAAQVPAGGFIAFFSPSGEGSLWRVAEAGRAPRVKFVGKIDLDMRPGVPCLDDGSR